MPYVDFSFLGKCRLCYSSVLLVPSNLTLSSSSCVSVATPASEEVISGDAASIFIFWIEKNNLSCNFVDFLPIITGAVTDTVKKTGKNSLDGKTLLQSPSYDINEEFNGI